MSLPLAALAATWDIRGDADVAIRGITEDSRAVEPGIVFVAIRGTADDGRRYIADAVARGAAAVVVESVADAPAELPAVIVPSTRHALAVMAARLHGEPARALDMIGFTGTFGKTTTSDVLQRLLNASGRRTGVVGSLGARFENTSYEHRGMTTPSPVLLHHALRRMRDAGADTVVMEVTSHALRLERAHGIAFGGGLLAAIRPGEHIDFHRNFDDYVASKRLFLDYLAPGALLAYDADSRPASAIARERADVRDVGFSLRRTLIGGEPADDERRQDNLRDRRILSLADAVLDDRGAVFTVDGVRLRSSLLGRGNLRNVALALTFARQRGLRLEDARAVLGSLTALTRRMERYDLAGRLVLDDTAGHPESFDATFEVADLIPARRIVVAYALRGSRGVEINLRNALSLAEHTQAIGASRTIITEAADTAGPLDRVLPGEAEAARRAFRDRGVDAAWHETMEAAMADAARQTEPGDLIVLVGAQGMNAGRAALANALNVS